MSYVEVLILYELWAELVLEKLYTAIGDLDAEFQCRLFLVVQTLIFSVLVTVLDVS